MSFSRKAVLTLTGIAALAMPAGCGGQRERLHHVQRMHRHAAESVYDHMNGSGQKMIKYETKVYCDAGRSIEIQD